MTTTGIIGAGPAGLTAAYELSKLDLPSVVLEQDNIVGGIARTESYKGYHFDIGGHRFFTKVQLIQQLWEEILEEDFLVRPRLSRIFYNGSFFDYPLKPLNALRGLGLWEATRIGMSYLWVQAFPSAEEENFEQWVTNRFGRRLYEIFFKTYTEKVWGMPCTEIRADWAAQRIKDGSPSRSAGVGQEGRDDHQSDRQLPLSTPRPGNDVGALLQASRRARRRDAVRLRGRRPRATGRCHSTTGDPKSRR